MAWWQRVPIIRRVTAVGEAGALAHALIRQGVDDAEAVSRLRAVRGGRRALHDAARVAVGDLHTGYPVTRIYRLLRTAAEEPVPELTLRESEIEHRQRQLWEQPFSVSFNQLADEVPELRELERRAQRETISFLRGRTSEDSPLSAEAPSLDDRAIRARVVSGIDQAVKRLLGPTSGRSDPVLSSAAATRAAYHHLRETAGIGPLTGGGSG